MFSVTIDRETHRVTQNEDAVFVGAQCESCGDGEFEIRKDEETLETLWSIVCYGCNEQYFGHDASLG